VAHRAGDHDSPRRRRPSQVSRPQFDHADLGLVDDDNTEDLRRTAPVNPVATTPGGDRCEPTHQQKERLDVDDTR
jgi:hypothetical protein